jgi:hypothetical protein
MYSVDRRVGRRNGKAVLASHMGLRGDVGRHEPQQVLVSIGRGGAACRQDARRVEMEYISTNLQE